MASKLPLLLVVPFAISCGGDDTPHTIKTPDSGMGSGSQVAPDTCKVNSTYATLTFMGSNAAARATELPAGSQAPHRIYSYGALEAVGSATVSADYVNLDLWATLGGFGSGDLKTGTYVLMGDDTDYYACGICLYLQGDYLLQNEDGTADDWLMASSGTVNLTAISGSAYKATVTNADFRRITNKDGFPDPDGGDQTDVACTSHIDSITFDIALKQGGSGSGSGSAVGKPQNVRFEQRALRHRFY